ncbi:MAG: hypothetical protein RL091_615, partial [Verrucomicrobiota bacterium]
AVQEPRAHWVWVGSPAGKPAAGLTLKGHWQ